MINYMKQEELSTLLATHVTEPFIPFCKALAGAFTQRYETCLVDDVALAVLESLANAVTRDCSNTTTDITTCVEDALVPQAQQALDALGFALDGTVLGSEDLLLYARCCTQIGIFQNVNKECVIEWGMRPIPDEHIGFWSAVIGPSSTFGSSEAARDSLQSLLSIGLLVEEAEAIQLPQNLIVGQALHDLCNAN